MKKEESVLTERKYRGNLSAVQNQKQKLWIRSKRLVETEDIEEMKENFLGFDLLPGGDRNGGNGGIYLSLVSNPE